MSTTTDPATPDPAGPDPAGPDPAGPDPAAPGGGVRASDAERERTVARLHDALGEGRLDLSEAETRTTAAYAARFRDELPPLLADLPDGGDAREPADTHRGPGAPTWAAALTDLMGRRRLPVGLVVGLVAAWLLLCLLAGLATAL